MRDIIRVGIDGRKEFGNIKMTGKAIIDTAKRVNKDRNGKALSVRFEQWNEVRVQRALEAKSCGV